MHSESSSSRQRRRSIVLYSVLFAIISLLLILGIIYSDNWVTELSHPVRSENPSLTEFSTASVVTHRKLLNKQAHDATEHNKKQNRVAEKEPNRIWSEKCSKSDIMIIQGASTALPSGIPTYTVEITNVCVTGCVISAIHLNCGWFSSARLINPRIFKRLRFNDCIVNNGEPLANGRALSFQYANTFRYPLSVASLNC